MRRGPVAQRFQQEAEAFFGLLLVDAQHAEHPLLKLGVVDTDGTPAGFGTVDDQIVGQRPAAARVAFQVLHVLGPRSGKRVVFGLPAAQLLVPFEHGELHHPGEVHPALGHQFELLGHAAAQSGQGAAGQFVLVGHQQQQVAGFGFQGLGDPLLQRFVEVFGNGRVELAPFFHAEPGQPFGSEVLLDEQGQLVDPLAGIVPGALGDADPAHAPARFHRLAKHPELALGGQVADVVNLQPVTQIGSVVAVAAHRLVVSDARQRQRHFQVQQLSGQASHQRVDDRQHVVHLHERHLQVQLGELRLPVRPQVFVAEAPGHLHVAVIAGNHQNLLVKLRRLRQRVELARMHAAGHQVVAGPLGRAAAQHRGFDFQKAQLVEVVAHQLGHPVPQLEHLLHAGAAQVQVAMAQAHLLAGQVLVLLGRRDRRRQAAVEQLQGRGPQFHLARGQFRVFGSRRPPGHLAGDSNHVLGPQPLGRLQQFLALFGADHHLGFAVAIPKVEEHRAPVIAQRIHPAAERALGAHVLFGQFAAGVRA